MCAMCRVSLECNQSNMSTDTVTPQLLHSPAIQDVLSSPGDGLRLNKSDYSCNHGATNIPHPTESAISIDM